MSDVENNKGAGNSSNLPMRDERGRILPGFSGNPAGKPKGRNWAGTLAELAETKIKGGGGKKKAEQILENLLERALTDNNACSIVLDRLDGKPIQRQITDLQSGGAPLGAEIRFIDAEPVPDPPEKR